MPATKEITEAAKSTEAAEQVAKLTQDIVHRHATAISAATHLLTGKSKLIIPCALVGIAQHIVGLSSLFELLLGSLLLGVALALLLIGVILDGQFTIGLFQVIGRSVLVHAKHLVIISLLSHSIMIEFLVY